MITPKIIILHGWGANKSRFLKLQEQLLQHKLSVDVPDLPGFGETPPLKNPWDLDDYVDWLNTYIGDQNEVILIGHSFGGQIAIAYTLKYPKQIIKIILVAPAAIRKTSSKLQPKYIVTKIGKIIFTLPLLNVVNQRIKNYWYRLIGNPDYYKASPIMKLTMQNIISTDLTDRFSEINNPVLLLWGKNDQSTPFKQSQIYIKKIPNCQRIEYPNTDHYFIYRQTEKVVNDIVRFII